MTTSVIGFEVFTAVSIKMDEDGRRQPSSYICDDSLMNCICVDCFSHIPT
jgi:hypothetical protein